MPRRTEEPVFRLPPFTVQQTFVTMAETQDWGLRLFGIPALWAKGRGEGVKVAVLDTGAALDHPDLRDQIEDAADFTRSKTGASDTNGHGTHCCGVIAAAENGTGVVGVAPKARLLVGKVLGDSGSGGVSGIARGLRWAADRGAHVISMSLGSAKPSPTLRAACRYATSKGALLVAAAGNEGPYDNTVGYPGGYPECLCVAAVDQAKRIAKFSSRGSQVDVAAPGVDVLSCYPPKGYAKLSGTSMATPFVAGVVALIVGRQIATGKKAITTVAELKAAVKKTAVDAGSPGFDTAFGWGLINPGSLVAAEAAAEKADLTIELDASDFTPEGLAKLRGLKSLSVRL